MSRTSLYSATHAERKPQVSKTDRFRQQYLQVDSIGWYIWQSVNINPSVPGRNCCIHDTMRSALLELPDECICTILSFLGPSQVKRVALTFNRRLLAIAKPFLKPLTKIKKDEAYFESLYGKINPNLSGGTELLGEKELTKLNFTNLPISIPARPSHYLEHLDLIDDLTWLENIVKEDDLDFMDDNGAVANWDTEGKDLKKLITTTTRLGLTLPQSFVKLCKNEHLHEKVPTSGAWYIEIHDLLKIRKQLEDDPKRHKEGYIFTWFCSQQGTAYKHMYLDTAGRHAILGSDMGPAMSKEEDEGEKEDWIDLTDLDKSAGIDSISSEFMKDFVLEDVNFESWLVNHYYAERYFFLDTSEEDEEGKRSLVVPDHMKKHFYYLYTEEGRRMQ